MLNKNTKYKEHFELILFFNIVLKPILDLVFNITFIYY